MVTMNYPEAVLDLEPSVAAAAAAAATAAYTRRLVR